MRESTLWQRLLQRRDAASPPLGGFVPVTGGRVHFLADGPVGGDGVPVVLLHGASGNLRDFAVGLMPALARQRRIIALDRPGFGHSDAVPGAERLAVQVRALREALRRLGHPRVHLVGHSYGGALALAWTLEHPRDVASLSLIGGVAMDWGGALSPTYRVTASPLFGQLVARAAAFAPPRYVEAQLKDIFAPAPVPAGYRRQAGVELALRPATFRLNARQILGVHREVVAMMPRYPQIDCPVTLIHGDADTIVPMAVHSEGLAGLVAQARLVTLKGAGHMPHHSHVAEVVEAIETGFGPTPGSGGGLSDAHRASDTAADKALRKARRRADG